MFKNAVILAGGAGSRMMPLTDYVPKPLIKVNGIPLLNYVINFLNDNNIEDITVTYGYKSEIVVSYAHSKVSGFINTYGKDNAYFLFNSNIKYINEPIIICPCDMIIKLDLEQVYKDYIDLNKPPACIIPAVTSLDADSISADGNLIKGISRGNISDKYCTGVQIINPYVINQILPPLTNFYDVWNYLINKGLLYMTNVMPSEWKVFDKIKDLQ